MELDAKHCYRALRTHDKRFDGRFFTGVTSTKIYCRPVCPARPPKVTNCKFYPTAAAAEAAGFRPCLRCRPELAPGIADVSEQLALRAVRLIEEGEGEELEPIAERLGVSDRHLRRVFRRAYGVSPIEFAQTYRLLAAKRLLTDTALPVTDVAFASGFRSLRRFQALFKERYCLKPSDLRGKTVQKRTEHKTDAITVTLSYRPPLAWEILLAFLAARAILGVEEVHENTYRRAVLVTKDHRDVSGWFEVNHKGGALELRVAAELAQHLPVLIAKIRRLFDLDCEPRAIEALLSQSMKIKRGLRVPGAFDGFELAVRAILGQQISVKAARTLACRLTEKFGKTVTTPFAAIHKIFPPPHVIAGLPVGDLTALGLTTARANTVLALAGAVTGKSLDLSVTADVAQTVAALQKIPGIGEWTAEYIAMRALAWPDAFLATDLGVKKALGETSHKKIRELAAQWQPWRAYATMQLWHQ